MALEMTRDIDALIRAALDEDVRDGDVTTNALVDAGAQAHARFIARHDCVVAGLDVVEAVFERLSPKITLTRVLDDGDAAAPNAEIAVASGPARALLTAERTALNFMQRMCGVATLTKTFVDRVEGRVKILDTRKTTPGYRRLEKYAVTCGGGSNHRMGLYDMAMVKDNHRWMWAEGAGTSLGSAVDAIREAYPDVPIEVEVESEAQLAAVLPHAPDWVMLDNMSPEHMARCVELAGGTVQLEASGGITLETIDAVSRCGVDAVSLGCLTHSAPAADISLEFEPAS